MTIFPLTQTYWSEETEEVVDTGIIIGYQAIGLNGAILGEGETIADAEEAALMAMYLPEPKNTRNTSKKLTLTRQSGGDKYQNSLN